MIRMQDINFIAQEEEEGGGISWQITGDNKSEKFHEKRLLNDKCTWLIDF